MKCIFNEDTNQKQLFDMANEKIQNESFFQKYFIHIWYVLGYVISTSYFFSHDKFEKVGFILSFIGSFIVAAPLGFLMYSVYVISSFMISLFVDGVKERDIAAFFGGVYLLIGLLMFLSGLSSN